MRPKFKKLGSPQERCEIIYGLINMDNCLMVNPQLQVTAIKEDPADNRFLECAVEGRAEIIISGDEHLLALKEFQGVTIISPSEFVNMYI